MRRSPAVVLSVGLLVTGCGWSPPSAPPPKADTCTPADGPTADSVQRALTAAAPPGTVWTEVSRGHTTGCRLNWVQVGPADSQPDSPQQLLFFDRNTPLGPATPQPRPYVSAQPTTEDSVTVQYQWRQGNEPPCCPTGIGTVRFRIGPDGKLEALDPIPNA